MEGGEESRGGRPGRALCPPPQPALRSDPAARIAPHRSLAFFGTPEANEMSDALWALGRVDCPPPPIVLAQPILMPAKSWGTKLELPWTLPALKLPQG